MDGSWSIDRKRKKDDEDEEEDEDDESKLWGGLIIEGDLLAGRSKTLEFLFLLLAGDPRRMHTLNDGLDRALLKGLSSRRRL